MSEVPKIPPDPLGPSRSESPPPDGEERPHAPAHGISLRELMLGIALLVLLVVMLTPSYRRARERELVARVKADMRSTATALEAYMIDNMSYPACGRAEGPSFTATAQNVSDYPWLAQYYSRQLPITLIPSGVATANSACPPGSGARRMPTFRLIQSTHPIYGAVPHTLTTPTAYLKSYFADPFADSDGASFAYFGHAMGWILWSPGPDRDENDPVGPTDIGPVVLDVYDTSLPQPSDALLLLAYDPTNGLRSDGDIFRVRN